MFDNNQKIPMISTFFGQGQTTHGLLKKLFLSRPLHYRSRSSRLEVSCRKRCSGNSSYFTGELAYRRVISIKLLCKFIEITLLHGCSPVNLLHIFRIFFLKNTSGGLLLQMCSQDPRKHFRWKGIVCLPL